jgi:hypothetical protein
MIQLLSSSVRAVAIAAVGFAFTSLPATATEKIDRRALVTRHNPVVREVNVDAPMTVGNGGFAFTCDITGLQTFTADYHREGVPVETQSRWCWVTDENPNNYTLADASKDFTLPDGRVMAFPTRQTSPAGDWLRRNPRIHPLGQLFLERTDGKPIVRDDIRNPHQTLDLWSGVVSSRYELDGAPVEVLTACHPAEDTVAVSIRSPLIARGALRVRLAFPRGYDPNVKNTPGLDWSAPESHESSLSSPTSVARKIGQTRYSVHSSLPLQPAGNHAFHVSAPKASESLEFSVRFSPEAVEKLAAPTEVRDASAKHWRIYWESSAAVDFTGSTHPLAPKIEERIILSRYLMGAQMAGAVPPQESGLTCSTWYGKHHTEMIWWHAAHFAVWGHDQLLAKNLEWYESQLPAAREIAKSRGLKGARWAKMVGPTLRESPGGNPLIVWNQPHLIYLSELLYRSTPTPETLNKYRALVLETAECMASMLHWDEGKKRYVLGPPLWIVQEIYDQATSQNPSFELAYWSWTLSVAQQWRERLGLPRDAAWDHVIKHLSPLPIKDGKYVALESHPDTWDNVDSRHDHPEMLMPLGFLPEGSYVDRATMERTLDAVLTTWDWETKIWGWDYPMIAMTAARLGRGDVAVEILMRNGPNNRYLPTGHCPQRSDEALPKNPPPGARKREIAVYLPANGAFLSAVALMAGGWDGAPRPAPGFPANAQWKVRVEGLKPFP